MRAIIDKEILQAERIGRAVSQYVFIRAAWRCWIWTPPVPAISAAGDDRKVDKDRVIQSLGPQPTFRVHDLLIYSRKRAKRGQPEGLTADYRELLQANIDSLNAHRSIRPAGAAPHKR